MEEVTIRLATDPPARCTIAVDSGKWLVAATVRIWDEVNSGWLVHRIDPGDVLVAAVVNWAPRPSWGIHEPANASSLAVSLTERNPEWMVESLTQLVQEEKASWPSTPFNELSLLRRRCWMSLFACTSEDAEPTRLSAAVKSMLRIILQKKPTDGYRLWVDSTS